MRLVLVATWKVFVRDADVDFLCEANFLCGSMPGDEITVTTAAGKEYKMKVPAGSKGGDRIQVNLEG